MPDKTWKAYERRVATCFGGKRRGADFRGEDGGKSDIICDGWSIEVKNWARPSFSIMLEDAKKAEERKTKPTDLSCAVIKRKGDLDADALVVFRMSEFEKRVLPLLNEIRLLKQLGML